MSKASGLVLIAAGLAVAAYMVPPRTETGEAELAQPVGTVEKAATAPDARTDRSPLAQPAFRQIATPAAPPPPAAAAPPSAVPPFSPPVVVTLAQRPGGDAAAPAAKTAPAPRDREGLTRELQRELKRVGCYDGEVNGVWTPGTRAAMRTFIERINATLPVDGPDPILFALVQGQQDKVCGKPCPAGEGLSQDGRCLPAAILAQAAKRGVQPSALAGATPPKAAPNAPTPAITGWTATTVAAAPPPAGPEGRMALAGPVGEDGQPAPVAGALPPADAAAAAAKQAPPRPAARPRSGRTNWAQSVFRHGQSPN